MKTAIFSAFLFIFPLFSSGSFLEQKDKSNPLAVPAGLILPRPQVNEGVSQAAKPLTIRIVNLGQQMIYLQGIREVSKEGKVQLYFYHREEGRGWKPYFDSLPCNLPTCRNLHRLSGGCGDGEPVVIRLGGKGSYNSIKEFQWGGLLYERSEATRESRKRRYCYKGWAPIQGQVRVEVEYSKTVSRDDERKELMDGRDHTAIEFDLPASNRVYEIAVNG